MAPRDIHARKRNGVTDWVFNQKSKKHAEVYMRKMKPKVQASFKKAMHTEVDSFLEREAIVIAIRAGVDPRKILNIRWALTWKTILDDAGTEVGRKPKARLIVRGFEDPYLLHVWRDSPTMAIQSRNVLLAVSAINSWNLFTGDIKIAFLNGDELPLKDQLFGDPPEEAREIWGMSQNEVLRLRKVIYGLLHAPRVWYDKLSRVLEN